MLVHADRSSLATAPSATPLPCRVPSNDMFHQDSVTQITQMEQNAILKNM